MGDEKQWLSRTELLIGKESLEKLFGSHVMVVGLGGVGSYAAEFIARSGVGKMTIVDGDTIDETNRNRQLPALATNIGQHKAIVMEERLKAINPDLELTVVKNFINPEMVDDLLALNPITLLMPLIALCPKSPSL